MRGTSLARSMKTSETLRGNASPRRSTKRSPGPGARRSKCSSPISSASWASTDFGSGDPAGQETSSPWPPSLRTCGSWPSFDLRRTEWRPPCDLRGATSARAPIAGQRLGPEAAQCPPWAQNTRSSDDFFNEISAFLPLDRGAASYAQDPRRPLRRRRLRISRCGYDVWPARRRRCGRAGGSEEHPCHSRTSQCSAPSAPPGTRAGSSAGSGRSCRSTSGRSECAWSSPRTFATSRSSTWPSTASCGGATCSAQGR